MTLKYRFTATFDDDTSIQQTPEDVSVVDPKRSAFFDVLAATDKQLVSFVLSDGTHSYGVDLRDGHFEIDGAPFWLIPEGLTEDPASFRIIYYRQHTHHYNAAELTEIDHQIRFVLGWQTTVGGKNYQQTITLD